MDPRSRAPEPRAPFAAAPRGGVRAAVLAALAVLALAPARASFASDAPPVLSVLDFDDRTGDPDLAWMSAGLADMLLSDLASAGLSVVDRDDLGAVIEEQSLSLSGLTDEGAAELGRLLSAGALLRGSYSAAAGSLRIDARIVSVLTGSVDATARASGAPADVFSLEADLVRDICAALGVEPPPRPGLPGTASVPAARAYYEGLVLQSSGDVLAAKARFEESIRLDPLYAKPRLSLEESWRLLADFRSLRRQHEMNALWLRAAALEARLAEDPFRTDADLIVAAMASGTPPPDQETDPSFGAASTPQVCLWNLQGTYWEIGQLAEEYYEDEDTLRAALGEMVRLGGLAEQEWADDPWFPEIFYQTLLARRWLGDWEGLKAGCERVFLQWPDYRMNWAVEDMYERALEELGGD